MPSPSVARFRLLRYFSIASLVGIVAVTVCLIATYRELTLRHLIEHEGRANAALTRSFANTTWARYRTLVAGAAGKSREALLADPLVSKLRAEVQAQMHGLPVVKLKVYHPEGLTVFSTDERQIGRDERGAPGILAAQQGRVISHISYREKFNAFEGEIAQRNLIASYVPVGGLPGGPPEAVFEVYSDVTDLLAQQNQAQWQVAGLVLALLMTLYAFLFVVVRKADRVIQRQRRERAVQEAAMRHQAFHDALTGLPNRTSFRRRLDKALAQASRTGRTAALLFLDLDRFKQVNDSLGHPAGDQLLKTVAQRLSACLREGDLLFRMGGDEFTVILPTVRHREEVALVAQRLRDAASQPVSIDGQEVRVGASVGVALVPSDTPHSADVLLRQADTAMYTAKANGRGTHAFYPDGAASGQPH